jgi:hypothetical protein
MLNQLQLLLQVTKKAESVLELFLWRLDVLGLEISSPWEACEAKSIAEVLWPWIHRAWLEKERWTGCQEVINDVWWRVLYLLKNINNLINMHTTPVWQVNLLYTVSIKVLISLTTVFILMHMLRVLAQLSMLDGRPKQVIYIYP